MRLLRLALPLFVLAACATTRTAARDPSPGPVLFTVTHPSKPGASLALFGTTHLQRADYRWDRAVERSLAEGQRLFVEIELSPDAEAELGRETLKRGEFPAGQSARDVLSASTWEKVQAACTRLHADAGRLARFKPWLIGLTLAVLALQQDGASDAAGSTKRLRVDQALDRRVLSLFHESGRPVTSLETVSQQLDLFSGGDAAQQESELRRTLDELSRPGFAQKTFGAYESGDLVALERAVLALPKDRPDAALSFKRMWTDRNAAMFEKLTAAFGAEPRQVVAVGAGHLLGDTGLVRRFEQAGYHVERARSEGPGPEWVMRWHRETTDGFEAQFPARPRRVATPLPGGATTATTLWQEGNHVFSVEVVTVPNAAQILSEHRAELYERTLGAMANGLKLLSRKPVKYAGRDGLHAVLEGAQPALRVETILIDDGQRFFSVRSVCPTDEEAALAADREHFFHGFKLVP